MPRAFRLNLGGEGIGRQILGTDKLIDDLLDSYGALETAHDRFCATIKPETYDRRKLIRLYLAATAYSRSVEAFKDAPFSDTGHGFRTDADPIGPAETPQGCSVILHYRSRIGGGFAGGGDGL